MVDKKIIVVFCHSRAELLSVCLSSLKNASGIESWNVVIVQQRGNPEVDKVIDEFEFLIGTTIIVKPNFELPLCNINFNRILGTRYAFETLHADYVLGIEEDTMVSGDALNFIDYAYNCYKRKKAFRGVNLGSMEYGENIATNGYSLLRYGLHGQAGVMTKNSWSYIRRNGLFEFEFSNSKIAWDAEIEFYLKSGFMITPNVSKSLDLGYGGTFSPKNKYDRYFVEMKKSWDNNNIATDIGYQKIQMRHKWRSDAIPYRKNETIIYFLRRNNFLNNLVSALGVKKIFTKWLVN